MGISLIPSDHADFAFLNPDICACIVQRQQQLSALHYSTLEMHFAPGSQVIDQANTIPVSIRRHRAHGRQTRDQLAERQQLLTPKQEKALVDHLFRLHKNGYTARVKHLRYFAGILLRQRDAAGSPSPPRRCPPNSRYYPPLRSKHWRTRSYLQHSSASLRSSYNMQVVQIYICRKC
jgi:hypothetical protein